MNYAVILSGGIGTRMHMGDFPKQYYKVKGKMILEYTLDAFEKSGSVDEIVIVMAPEWQEQLEEELRSKYKKLQGFAAPGSIRQESILRGLLVCMERSMRGTTEIAYVAGMKICMIPGDPMNFKITHPADLQRFRMIVGE